MLCARKISTELSPGSACHQLPPAPGQPTGTYATTYDRIRFLGIEHNGDHFDREYKYLFGLLSMRDMERLWGAVSENVGLATDLWFSQENLTNLYMSF
jgi:hypothetical protein